MRFLFGSLDLTDLIAWTVCRLNNYTDLTSYELFNGTFHEYCIQTKIMQLYISLSCPLVIIIAHGASSETVTRTTSESLSNA